MSDHIMRWLAPLPALIAGPALGESFLTLAQAQAQMFPGETLSKLSVELDATQTAAIEKSAGVRLRERTPKVWRASGGGWFFVDQVLGKHEYITYALALDAAGAVRAVEVLDYRESWGGDVRNPRWRAQFIGKTLAAPVKLGQDIANVSGATLSCRHLTEGVRRLLATQAELARRG